MSIDPDIKEVLDFLYLNVDFFAAQFRSPESYCPWARKKGSAIESMADHMSIAFHSYGMISDFRRALCGNIDDARDSLIVGQFERMHSFLQLHKRALTAFRYHLNDPVVDDWYQTQATPSQVERRERKQCNNEFFNAIWAEFENFCGTRSIREILETIDKIDKQKEIRDYHHLVICCLKKYRQIYQNILASESSEYCFFRKKFQSAPTFENIIVKLNLFIEPETKSKVAEPEVLTEGDEEKEEEISGEFYKLGF